MVPGVHKMAGLKPSTSSLRKKIFSIFFGFALPKNGLAHKIKTRDLAFWAYLEVIFQTSKTSHIAAKFDSKCPKPKLSITCDFQKKYHNFLRTFKKSQNFRAIWLLFRFITQFDKRGGGSDLYLLKNSDFFNFFVDF